MQRGKQIGHRGARAALLLLAILLSVTPVHAEVACGIEGVVVAPGYAWRQRVEVLQIQGYQLLNYTYTDTSGNFRLPSVHGDGYDVVIRIEGYLDHSERISAYGCRTQTRTFFMQRAPYHAFLDFSGEVNEVVDAAEFSQKVPREVLKEFEKARNDRSQNNNFRARKRLEEIVKSAPDFYEGHKVLGTVYSELKMFREAEAEYNKARQLKPRSAAPLVSLGSLYIQEAEASSGMNQGIPVVLLKTDLGVILDDARSVLLEAIKLRPEASFAHYLLGIVAYRTADDANAEKYFRRALEIEPRLNWAQIGLANLYIRQGKWKAAIEELDTYLEDFPNAVNRPEVEAIRQKVVGRL
jgi:Tfp pilus assembly protein PilF